MLDHLDDIRIFMRVAELESLSAAGRDMRKTPAVVSSRIVRLESAVGVSLLWRTTRQVKLTPEGETFLEHCTEIMRAVSKAEADLSHEDMKPSGPVRITVPSGIGESFVAPLLADFSALNPDINIQLHLSDRLANLVEEKYDLAIRVSELRESGLVVRKLAVNMRVICGSPEYLKVAGNPQNPDDLANHKCLLLRFPGSQQYEWLLKDKNGEIHNPSLTSILDSDRTSILKAWALAGHGLSLQNYWDVSQELKSGLLQVVLPDYAPEGHGIYAVYPRRRHMPPRLRATLDFLIKGFRDLNFSDNPIPEDK